MQVYQMPLAEGKTLCVYNGDQLIFSDSGRWLTPLFKLEQFLLTYAGERDCLAAHDTAAGKAAALLMSRMGIKKAHVNLISDLAIDHYRSHGIEVSWDQRIGRLACMTEELLSEMDDEEAMYRLLRQRAKLVRGVSVEVKDLGSASFSVEQGGTLILRGSKGRTLLNILDGTIEPSSGSVAVAGLKPSELPSQTIAHIPQLRSTNEQVRRLMEEAVDNSLPPDRMSWEIDTALRRTGVSDLADRSYDSLSSAEQLRVELARSLCQQAKLLLLDDPSTALGDKERAILVGILQSLTIDEMPTLLLATEDPLLVQQLNWPVLEIRAL